MKNKKVIVAGGGIAGLCTALALHKMGFQVEVYEKAPVLQAAGAGIIMAANARKVFQWLGIDEEVVAVGMPLERLDITDGALVPFRKQSLGLAQANPQDRLIGIHRAKLQAIFLSHVPEGMLRTGAAYVSHTVDERGVTVNLSDGGIAHGDLLLGADGIHSKVRAALFPQSELRYSGQTSWRGVVEHGLERGNAYAMEAWASSGRFGLVPIGERLTYWYAVEKRPAGGLQHKDERPYLLKVFQDFAPEVRTIIQSTAPEAILHTDIWDLKRLDSWHQGPVCLIGDAAHATTPNLGQGGAQGIEDAWYMANLLKRATDPAAAFAQFEARRRKKVDSIVNVSWRMGQLAHSPIGRRLMQLAIRFAPESSMKKQFAAMQAIDQHFD